MKSLRYAALPVLLGCVGCFNPLWLDPEPPKPAPVVKAAPPAPVTPDSVNPANAREKCDALINEIDRAENR
jgi:hypothetical protein